ncbi:autoinducer binding domain-containing protein [Pseudaeromonas sharmana]|uniref:Autoinducer binding domain-containing protein n=1 Tax=Pseudaeromonas sharmana TaxID=328412 RepID=A0ABV8CML6_9GAMM
MFNFNTPRAKDDALRSRITQIRECSSAEALNHLLAELAADAAFDHYQLNLFLPSGLLQSNLSIFSHEPSDWLDYYWSNQLVVDDPLVKLSFRLSQPILWDEIGEYEKNLSANASAVMALRSEYGMAEGMTLPIHSGQGHHGMMHLSRREANGELLTTLELISPLLPYLFNKACDLLTPPHPRLSDRERECLFWVSEGKTSWEAARILGITERTVNFHLNSAIRKTGCKNRYQAIARNVAAGQLRPDMQRLNITRIVKA